jgi:hypothetical protein
MVAVEVEDEEVAGHDAVPLAEPPPPAGQIRRAGAVKEELRGSYAGGAAAHPQHDLIRPHVDHLAELAGQPDGVLVGVLDWTTVAGLKRSDGVGCRRGGPSASIEVTSLYVGRRNMLPMPY